MKKIILTAVFIIATITVTKAQDIRFGVRGGINFTTPSFEVTDATGTFTPDTKNGTSFYLGGLGELSLNSVSDKFILEFGLNYAKNTFDYKKDFKFRTLSTNQINIPILLKYEAVEKAFIKGGLYGSFIVSAENERDGTSTDVSDEISSFDYGLLLGAEYNLDNGIFFEAMYNLGFADLSKNDGSNKIVIKNRGFQIGLGYKF